MSRVARALVLCLLAALPAAGQAELESLPGFFPAQYLDLVEPGQATVEINLQGAMLRMISAFTGDDDPEFAELVAALDGIRVRSGEVTDAELPALRQRLHAGQAWLVSHGWLAMVRVREDDEEVYVYTREADGALVGMTVLALEDGEATAVNLIGRVDPALLAHLAQGLDIHALEGVRQQLTATGDQP